MSITAAKTVLKTWKAEEQARSVAAAQAHREYQVARKESLRPVFETAQFVGFSSNMPTNLPLIVDAGLADFIDKDGKSFSLFIDLKDMGKLAEDHDYLVGFAPSHLHEHAHSPVAMQFFINSMMRSSPILGNFADAQPLPDGIVKKTPNAATIPSPRG